MGCPFYAITRDIKLKDATNELIFVPLDGKIKKDNLFSTHRKEGKRLCSLNT